MAKEVSSEEYRAMMAKKETAANSLIKPVIGIIIVVVLCSISFYSGLSYQKKHTAKGAAGIAAGPATGRRGFGGARQGFTIGAVTAISSTSISVNNTRTNAVAALAITSSSTITNNGQSATTDDIKVGDTVLVQADSANSAQAAHITVNPSFGGGNAPSQGSNNPST
jgi:hypothetical protein